MESSRLRSNSREGVRASCFEREHAWMIVIVKLVLDGEKRFLETCTDVHVLSICRWIVAALMHLCVSDRITTITKHRRRTPFPATQGAVGNGKGSAP